MELYSPSLQSQKVRFGLIIVLSTLVSILWASPLPVMLQHKSRRPVFAGYEADYLFLLGVYIASILLSVAFTILIIKTIKNYPTLSQVRRFLIGNTLIFFFVIVGVSFFPRDTLVNLQKMAFVCITLQGSALLISWLRFRLRYLVVIFSIYLLIESASFVFLSKNSGLNRYLPQDSSTEPVKPTAIGVCLSGCLEQPEWTTFVLSNPIYKNTVMHWSALDWYDVTHEFNNMGLRGPDTTYESTKYRIFILGHSYVQQMQVNNEDTVGQQLQEMLDDVSDQEYEVLQLGIDYGFLGTSYQYYYHEGYKFNPDLVLHVSTSEIGNANAAYFTPERSDFVYAMGGDELYTYRLSPNIPVIIQNYAKNIGQTLYDFRIRTPLTKVLLLTPIIDRMLSWGIFLGDAEEGVEYSVQLLQDIVASWKKKLEQSHTDFAIVRIWDHNTYLEGEPANNSSDSNLLESFDVPIIDTMEHFSAVMQNGVDLDYYDEYQDNHFNAQGYHELAIVIFDWLVKEDIVQLSEEE